MKREREVEKILVAGIKKLGGVAFKWVSPGQDGVPDRIVLLPGGDVTFVELKTEVGRLAPRQKVQINRLRSMSFEVRVLYGEEQVKEFLQEKATELEVSHGV